MVANDFWSGKEEYVTAFLQGAELGEVDFDDALLWHPLLTTQVSKQGDKHS